jgi:undecaprenyl-diphosphatase
MNEKLFLLINSYAGHNQFLDKLGIFLAKGTPYIFILIEAFLYFVIKKKKTALFAFYSVVVALIINQIIGLFYFHNRPFMDGIGTMLIQHKPENSFPSDHTTFLFAIAFSFLLFKVERFFEIFVLTLAFLGGIARIYTGVHYPFDILGGIVTGFIGALIVYLSKNRLEYINNLILKIDYILFRGKI